MPCNPHSVEVKLTFLHQDSRMTTNLSSKKYILNKITMLILNEKVLLDYPSGVQNEPQAAFAECSWLPDLTFQLNPLYIWWWRISQDLWYRVWPKVATWGMGSAGRLNLMNALLLSLIKSESRLNPRMRGIGNMVWHRRVPAFSLIWCVTTSKTLSPDWILCEIGGLTHLVTTRVPSLLLVSWRETVEITDLLTGTEARDVCGEGKGRGCSAVQAWAPGS